MNYTNSPDNLDNVKQAVRAFENLRQKVNELNSQVNSAGWAQRNALISHVYSNYNNHEELIEKKSRWEELIFERNVHCKLLEYLSDYRDLYGFFPDYRKMISAFDDLIALSITKEEFEIASILKKWRDQFPSP